MRASSLSNAKVIDLLNSYFIPVYLRNEDCADDMTEFKALKKSYTAPGPNACAGDAGS